MRPIVFISGLSLTLGCATHEEPATSVAPPPGPIGEATAVPPRPTSNPPPPERLPMPADALPGWDDVASPHPEGATNPPMPILAINSDGTKCYKEWRDPRAVPREALRDGGRIIGDDEEDVRGTQIACPAERVQKILQASAPAEGGDGAPH